MTGNFLALPPDKNDAARAEDDNIGGPTSNSPKSSVPDVELPERLAISLLESTPVFLDASGRAVIQQISGPAIKASVLAYIRRRHPLANLHISSQADAI